MWVCKANTSGSYLLWDLGEQRTGERAGRLEDLRLVKIHLKYEELLETEEINYSEGLKCHYSFKWPGEEVEKPVFRGLL